MQGKAVIWIIRAFCTLLLWGIKAIASLIPIYLLFEKISGRQQLRTTSLPTNNTLNSLLDNHLSNKKKPIDYSWKT